MSLPTLRDREPVAFRLGDEEFAVGVRESARARTARMIVGPRRREVIVPRRAKNEQVVAFLEQKRGWIEWKVAAARETAARVPQLGLDGSIWMAGERVPVEIVMTTAPHWRARAIARLRDGRLVVGEIAKSDPAWRDTAAKAIESWYRREAKKRIEEAVEREGARLDLRYGSLRIRDQRTRWGSCSARGNLSFSWRLVVAPPEIIDYVVVHELCHLRQPNHSTAFWRVLEAARPGWQEQARWLREHGQELHDYDPATALERHRRR